MEHLALPGGQSPLFIPVGQPFHHPGHLQQIPAFQPEHIFPITAVPVGGHVHFNVGNGGNDAVRLLPVDDRAHTDLIAVFYGDHHQHSAHRQLKHIILSHDTVDFLLHNAVHNAGTMHRVNDFVPYLKHDPTSQ